jgi:hypothetical protein
MHHVQEKWASEVRENGAMLSLFSIILEKRGYVVTHVYVPPGIPQHIMVRVTEFLFGWSTVDVYLVSIGAAVVELHQLAEGTMPDFCKAIAELPLGGESVWPE